MRIVAAVLLALGCGSEPPPAPPPIPGDLVPTGSPVVTVDGDPITDEMVDAVVRRLPAEQREKVQASGDTTEIVDRMVVSQLLWEQAIAAGLHEDPEVSTAVALAARDVLAQAMAEKVGRDAVTPERIEALYAERSDVYGRPEVRVRHILVSDYKLAQSLREDLDAGADFAALAAEYSQEPDSRARGGDLGWFQREEVFAEIADAAFAADDGALLGPLETRLGFHLVKVEGHRDATPLEDARTELEAELRAQALVEWIATSREQAVIAKGPPAAEPATQEGAP